MAATVPAAYSGNGVRSFEPPGEDETGEGIWVCGDTALPPQLWATPPGGGAPGGGFGQDGVLDGMGPGPELGLLLPGAGDVARLSDEDLTGVVHGWRRMGSWAAAMEHAAVAELVRRRIAEAGAGGGRGDEVPRYAAAEVAAALTLTRTSADALMGRAVSLAGLPATWAALAAGVIDVPKALVIRDGVACLSADLARVVEAEVVAGAGGQTTGELRKAVAAAVIAADPSAADARVAEAQRSARVERWAEPAGTAALAGRDLPSADALAAGNRVNALAAALKADGAPGGMDLLRAEVFLGLLLGRPVAAPAGAAIGAATGPAADTAAQHGHTTEDQPTPDHHAAPQRQPTAEQHPTPDPPPGGGWAGITGSVNLTVPLRSLLGQPGQPAEVAGFGPVSPSVTGEILAAARHSPAIRWCVTVTGAGGRAVGHGCARRVSGGPAGPGGWGFTLTVRALEAGDCSHARESAAYRPPPLLRHLIQTRHRTCTYPGCGRPARNCDVDHSVPHDEGGRTCECNLAPLCRIHHKVKQAEGWHLKQIHPGVLEWIAPSGWRYTIMPSRHPI